MSRGCDRAAMACAFRTASVQITVQGKANRHSTPARPCGDVTARPTAWELASGEHEASTDYTRLRLAGLDERLSDADKRLRHVNSSQLRPPNAVNLYDGSSDSDVETTQQRISPMIMCKGRPAKKAATRRGDRAKLTRSEVYDRMRRNVYPPCSKSPSNIRMADDIASDLGFVGSSKPALSARTNTEFGLVPPNYLTPQEMAQFTYVRDHVAATCDKLEAAGRLDP